MIMICCSIVVGIRQILLQLYINDQLSAWPEVRGTADTDGGAYFPFLLVLTHDFIIVQLYGPADGDGQDGLNDADAGLHTILDVV